jgi:UPF0755 protein
VSRIRWIVAAGAVILVGTFFAGGFAAWRALNSPIALPAESPVFEVAAGTPLARLAEDLGMRGLLPHPRLLTWYARLTGDATRVKAGEYRIPPGASPLQLLEILIQGNVLLHQFTVVEGWRSVDVLAAMRAHPAIRASDIDLTQLMAELGAPDTHPEGQFLPDTYVFPRGTTDLELLRWAHTALVETLDRAWETRSPDVALSGPYEALILASIIERETALAAERALISGVFHERLRRGMRLQTDPTVIYGLGDAFDGNLRRRDLARDTPYNTYTRRGLPPTPIALAGAASIEAALNPRFEGALYFVATGEPDGSHQFSATIDEHNEAVRQYLRRLRGETD